MVLPAYAFYEGPSVPHAIHGRAGCWRDGVRRDRDRTVAGMVAARGRGRRGDLARGDGSAARSAGADGAGGAMGSALQPRPETTSPHASCAQYRGERILASMGSLAHYMQELSHEGIHIRDFVHEGNLPHWQEAIESPKHSGRLDSRRGARRRRGPARDAHARIISVPHRLHACVLGWRCDAVQSGSNKSQI